MLVLKQLNEVVRGYFSLRGILNSVKQQKKGLHKLDNTVTN